MTSTLPQGLTPGVWKADPSHSEAAFIARHAGIAKVRGTVAIKEAEINVSEDYVSSSVKATLDATSINTRDANRDAHLKSRDFFEIESNPTWTFRSTSIEPDGEEAKITGELTIGSVTREVVLDAEFNGAATDPFGNERIGFSAKTEISRKDFGITWNAALETGGVLVGDKIKIELEISAIKA